MTGDCAIYIRVSTLDQGERYSLPSQLKRLREKAEREGYRVREDWIFVDRHTGKLESRPAFDKLKALVRTGAPAAAYIFDVSRFARKALDALWLAADFKRHGVQLGFCEMPYEDTPTGRLTFTQMAAVAEYIGEKIIEDSKRGARQKLEQGKLTHGSAPYAYLYIDKRHKDGSRFIIDTSMSSVEGLTKVEVVRMVFRWRRIGWGPTRIMNELNHRGILSAGYWGKGGKWVPPGLWTRQTVLQMLKNRTYVGEHIRSGVVVPCEAIIDRELFDAVQRVNQESRERTQGRPSKNQYLFTTYLWCKKCNHRMTSNPGWQQSGKHVPNYLCCYQDRAHHRLCRAPQIACVRIEPVGWTAIWELITNPRLLLAQGKAYYSKQTARGGTAKLERKRERLRTEIEKTGRMMRKSLMDFDEGEREILATQKQLRQIEEELHTAGRVVFLPSERQAEAALRKIADPRNEPQTFADRRSVLEAVQDLRMEYYDGELTIEGKVPMPLPAADDNKNNCNPGLGADSKGQREHCCNGESWTLAHSTKSVTQVLIQASEEEPTPRLADILLQKCNVS
jgi:DNA invertase Pin-like site-specific DNA recombinase